MKRRMIEIGERLRKEREKAGYSQEAFTEKIGCCAITISRWENGHTPMKAMDIIKTAESLDISADYLLGIERNEDTYADIIGSLSSYNKEIVMKLLETLLNMMKS